MGRPLLPVARMWPRRGHPGKGPTRPREARAGDPSLRSLCSRAVHRGSRTAKSARSMAPLRLVRCQERITPSASQGQPGTALVLQIRVREARYCPYLAGCFPASSGAGIRSTEPNIALVLVSGGRGSNPRPQAWEACALPTELPPHRADSTGFAAASACARITQWTRYCKVVRPRALRARDHPPPSGGSRIAPSVLSYSSR